MVNLIAIFIGGGLGSVLRYLISLFFIAKNNQMIFPWSTFFANVLACIVFAVVILTIPIKQSNFYLLMTAGFCGGLSTMSTFSFEIMRMIERGQYFYSAIYVLLSLVACIACFALVYKNLN